MSHMRNAHKSYDKSRTDLHAGKYDGEGEINACNASESRTYAVTVSKKPSASVEEETALPGQRSFISIHSTDQLIQVAEPDSKLLPEECNVEVISLNEVFPSTSDESLSTDDVNETRKKKKNKTKNKSHKMDRDKDKFHSHGTPGKSSYVPTCSKSTVSARQKDVDDISPSVYSDYNIPKNTLYVTGSNPGEPKMSYQDPPKKISKTMKKFLRNIDKQKMEQNKAEKSKLTTMRGILKDGRCGPESTGDYTVQDADDVAHDVTLPYPMDFGAHVTYGKQQQDNKNVSFNTQVVIIHFSGDLCVGQSVETLSKEKDQQARNSELRKTFLTKYNEFWPQK